MATWVVGDIHGCAAELKSLLDAIGLGGSDRLLACGDLLHRGPDPIGVVDVLETTGARFVLGNHERALLLRLGLAPRRVDGADVPPGDRLPAVSGKDLRGDAGLPLHLPDAVAGRVLQFLLGHSGYLLTSRALDGAGTTRDGRDWWLVHAGIRCDLLPAQQHPGVLTRLGRTEGPGRPYWYEDWYGPELVLFGHTPSRVPRVRHVGGRLVALGLDTGCVYGGRLTAYSPDLDRVSSVKARRAYARAA
jgi:hypothetical protein